MKLIDLGNLMALGGGAIVILVFKQKWRQTKRP